MTAVPKLNPIRDRKYLDWLRTRPCLVSGYSGEGVDPAHIGTLGRGIKSGDDEALPLRHIYHMQGHNSGEMSMFRQCLPDDVLRACLRAYARERFMAYLKETGQEQRLNSYLTLRHKATILGE